MAYLYDLPLEFYRHACTDEDGNYAFDARKLAERGYNDVQIAEIKKALSESPVESVPTTADTRPLVEAEEEG